MVVYAFSSPHGEDACCDLRVKGASGCSRLPLVFVGGWGVWLLGCRGSDRGETSQGLAEVSLFSLPGLVGAKA